MSEYVNKKEINELTTNVTDIDIACILTNEVIKSSLLPSFELLVKTTNTSELSKHIIQYSIKSPSKDAHVKVMNLNSNIQLDSDTLYEVSKKITYYATLSNFEDIKVYAKIANDFINGKLFRYYTNKYMDHKDVNKFLEDVKSLDLRPISSLPIDNLGMLDVNDLMELLSPENVIPSVFPEINNCTTVGGYLKGSVVAVAAAPGKGKTQFIFQEEYNMSKVLGLRILHLALGDMMPIDFISRLGAIHFGVSQKTIIENINTYYNDELKEILKNIDISIMTPGTLSIEEFIESYEDRLSKIDKPYDVIVADYDANFSNASTGENSYNAHKIIYNGLMKIAKGSPYTLVISASQIKTQYFNDEIIPLDGLAESSNKQAIIDMLVTLSRFESKMQNEKGEDISYGYINLAKMRRGTMKSFGYTSTAVGKLDLKTTDEVNMIKGVKS